MTKKILLAVLTILTTSIFTQEQGRLFNLNNISSNSPDREREEVIDKNSINNIKVLPKSFYIGQLSDRDNSIDSDDIAILDSVNKFFSSISNGSEIPNMDSSYIFIFKNRYDFLISNGKSISDFKTGVIEKNSIENLVYIEFLLKDEIYTGEVYTEISKPYRIMDIQIEKKDKVIFDPTSYKNNLY